MGTYNKGILGAFSGKVGPVVGATWRGKEVMRSLPRRSKKEPTEAQLTQRMKFSTATAFLTPLKPITSRYFKGDNILKTRQNQALSYHMTEALTFVDPNYVITLNKVQISKGDLTGMVSGTLAAGAGQSVDFNWTDNSTEGDAQPTDVLVVALYEPTTKTTVYSLNAGLRSAGSSTVVVPAYLSGLTLHAWATFVSADEKKYATSIYLNSVIIG